MFNADNGKKLLEQLHDAICEEEDVDLWYEDDFYNEEECWDRAASDLMGRKSLFDKEGYTDLIAFLTDGSDDSLAGEMFADGFAFYLACELDWIHQSL